MDSDKVYVVRHRATGLYLATSNVRNWRDDWCWGSLRQAYQIGSERQVKATLTKMRNAVMPEWVLKNPNALPEFNIADFAAREIQLVPTGQELPI